jgi:hypothetical protein
LGALKILSCQKKPLKKVFFSRRLKLLGKFQERQAAEDVSRRGRLVKIVYIRFLLTKKGCLLVENFLMRLKGVW